ncbi:MAG: hypothetical protein K6T85_01835 [Gorillibacterium sp.]|nr:hypothetical protein [Gorillibacterium sp.]
MAIDALKAAKIRLMANACMTRYDRGEGSIEEFVSSYNMQPDNETLVLAQIVSKRPNIPLAGEPKAE